MYCSEHCVYRKIAVLKSLNCTTSKKQNSDSYQDAGLILVSKDAELCALLSNKVFFSISEFKKIMFFGIFSFRQKCTLSNKTSLIEKQNEIIKNSSQLSRAKGFASIQIRINSVS